LLAFRELCLCCLARGFHNTTVSYSSRWQGGVSRHKLAPLNQKRARASSRVRSSERSPLLSKSQAQEPGGK